MDLKFIVNPNILFYEALVRGTRRKGWEDLQNDLWDKYRAGYKLLKGSLYTYFLKENYIDEMGSSLEEMGILVKEGMQTEEFGQLLEDTEKYKEWLEKEWKSKCERIYKELGEIIKSDDLLEKQVEVYVVDKSVGAGKFLDIDAIIWGNEEEWKNYSVVYLVHEFLHTIIPKSKVGHAVIELATDNELRVRLNGGVYFEEGGEYVGHERLRETEVELLPSWKKYLRSDNENILEFIERMQKSVGDT